MITFGAIIEVLTAFFKFPGQVTALIKMLRATPEEQHQDLLKKMQKEVDAYAQTGRPTW